MSQYKSKNLDYQIDNTQFLMMVEIVESIQTKTEQNMNFSLFTILIPIYIFFEESKSIITN